MSWKVSEGAWLTQWSKSMQETQKVGQWQGMDLLYRQDCWSIGHRCCYLEAVNYWVFKKKKKSNKNIEENLLLVPGHVAFLFHFFVKDWQRGVQSVSLWFCDCAGVCVCLVCVLGGGEGQGCPSGFISVFKDHNRITHSFIQVRSRSLNNLFL